MNVKTSSSDDRLIAVPSWLVLIVFTIAGLALWRFPTFTIGAIVVLWLLMMAIVALSKWWRVILPLMGCYIVLHFIVKYW